MNKVEELQKKKIPELKQMLKKMSMKVSGNKKELIDRLTSIKKDDEKDDKDNKVIDLSNQAKKKLKLGNLIINIHNSLGGDPNHPYVNKVAKKADKLNPDEQKIVIDKIKTHVEKAKKFPTVNPVKSLKKIGSEKISAKTQKLKDKIVDELKEVKKSKGMNKDFKATLEGLFGKK